MVRQFLGCGLTLFFLTLAAPTHAQIVIDTFSDANYVPGNALSSYFWETEDDSAGVLDIEHIGGEHGNVVKLTANGPSPGPGFPLITAQAGDTVGGGWDGPERSAGSANPADDNQLWFAVDVQKGAGDASTSLTDFIWRLSFGRANGAHILSLDGGLSTFRLKTGNGSGFPTINTPVFNLKNGWNQVAVKNDLDAHPSTVLYLNGVQVASIDEVGGPLASASTDPDVASLTRLGRGGTGDHFVGSMRFDNVITSNVNILKFLPGDVNADGNVNIFDINLVSAHWSEGGPTGDANHDNIVNIFDINLISANWTSTGSAVAVPEPATWVLLSLGLAALLVVGRRRMNR